jgi:hypothetical protein
MKMRIAARSQNGHHERDIEAAQLPSRKKPAAT